MGYWRFRDPDPCKVRDGSARAQLGDPVLRRALGGVSPRAVSVVSGKPTSERKCTVLESCDKTGDGDHM